MSDENDSWFKPFGFDPAKFVADAAKTIENTANTVVQEAKAVVQQAGNAVSSAVKTVASAVPSLGPKPSAVAGTVNGSSGGSSVSSLGGSVGEGGKNNPDDVKAVQAALNSRAGAGLAVDGKCGGGTIAAIKAFQKTLGQARHDGRVDAGGATSRALAGGAKGASAAASVSAPAAEDDDSGSFFDRAVKGVKDLGGKILKEAEEGFDAATAFGGEVIEGAKNALGNPAILPISLVADLNAAAGRGDIADRLIAKLKSGGDLRLELGELSRQDMRTILDVMVKIKQAGKLGEFEDRMPANLSPRIGVAFLTIDLKFDDVTWEQGVAKLSAEDRKAVLERTPKQFAAQFETNDDPTATQEEAEKALIVFLDKVQKDQGGSTLRVSDTVRVAGNAVAFGISNSDTKIKNFLARKDLTGQPAVLAREIASRLPSTIPRANLKRLAGLPVDEASGTQAKTLLAALVAGVIKDVDKIIKLLPKGVQDEIRKAVEDAVEAGVLALVTLATSDTKLDEDSKKQIQSIVGAAIKQHPSQSSFDNKQGTEGSPDARERPPPIGPLQPEQPAIEGEEKFKGPEIKTPDGPPPNPKPPEKPEKP